MNKTKTARGWKDRFLARLIRPLFRAKCAEENKGAEDAE
jgi:hypothetical protein